MLIGSTVVSPEPHVEANSVVGQSQVHYKGKNFLVPSANIEGRTVVTTGRWLKVAVVREEELIEGDTVEDPDSFVQCLKGSDLGADLFTFAQRLPNVVPQHQYVVEQGNVAAVPITTYNYWLRNRAEYSVRKGVNRAKKLGVTVEVVEFGAGLVEGITRIYNETPVRQGKAFWHYRKDFAAVWDAMATYLDRSYFLGAYYQSQLIGFMKCTRVNSTVTITQILSMKEHFDKKPNNALIAKAIEQCEAEGRSHFIYGDFVYFDPNSSLTEFKRRLGFERVDLPRYYIPLTSRGQIALGMGFHRELARQIPQPMVRAFLLARAAWYKRKAAK